MSSLKEYCFKVFIPEKQVLVTTENLIYRYHHKRKALIAVPYNKLVLLVMFQSFSVRNMLTFNKIALTVYFDEVKHKIRLSIPIQHRKFVYVPVIFLFFRFFFL